MVSKRNRHINIVNFLESCDIEINIGKNKAQGNKGFFKAINKKYRIDLSKNLSDDELLGVLAHEFAHFIHYKYNNKLDSLDFIFPDYNEIIEEELIKVTVDLIDKKTIEPLFDKIKTLKTKIKSSENFLKASFPDKKFSEITLLLEKKIKYSNLKYLLKYNKVKVLEGFKEKYYSIENLSEKNLEESYILYKSKQRLLKRLNSKISRLNRYYNSRTELFARAFELFITNKTRLLELAPYTYEIFENIFKTNTIPMLTEFCNKANKIK